MCSSTPVIYLKQKLKKLFAKHGPTALYYVPVKAYQKFSQKKTWNTSFIERSGNGCNTNAPNWDDCPGVPGFVRHKPAAGYRRALKQGLMQAATFP